MIKSNNLKKIYIQDPNPENVKSNLLKSLGFTVNFLNQIGIEFTLVSNCNNFLHSDGAYSIMILN